MSEVSGQKRCCPSDGLLAALMLALFLSTSAVPRPPLAKERALHASSPEINWPWELSTPDVGDLSSCIFDAPTPEYDPFMHVKGTPSILFGVMTGTETVEARAKSVLLTWCADLDACIFFSDEHNENKQPATCAPAPSPPPSLCAWPLLHPTRIHGVPPSRSRVLTARRRQARHEHVDKGAKAAVPDSVGQSS